MEEHVREMMALRIEVEEFIVEHMGDPRQRVPVRSMSSRERPGDTLLRKSFLNLSIVCNILIIIIVEKLVTTDLPIDSCC